MSRKKSQLIESNDMWRWCVLLGAGLLHSVAALAADDFPERVLFVGNSYFYYNNSLHNHLKGFVQAGSRGKEHKLDYKSATISGADLDDHPIEWLTEPGRIGVKVPFELVVLAGHSADALSERSRQRFAETVQRFDRVIRARGGRTVLYMTHAYVSPHRQAASGNMQKIASMFSDVARQTGATVIPVGLAFEESYKRRPDVRLHDEHDGSHPSVAGTYLAAAVAYKALYGLDPVGNAYNYHGKVAPDLALHLQKVARDVMVGP